MLSAQLVALFIALPQWAVQLADRVEVACSAANSCKTAELVTSSAEQLRRTTVASHVCLRPRGPRGSSLMLGTAISIHRAGEGLALAESRIVKKVRFSLNFSWQRIKP